MTDIQEIRYEAQRISEENREPEWMRRLRLQAVELYAKLPEPRWLPDWEGLDVQSMILYRGSGGAVSSWEDLPPEVRRIYERLNLPELEKKYLAGLSATMDSSTVYASVSEKLRALGVILEPMNDAVRTHEDIVRRYFSRIFPAAEHKYSALHYALWSGGVFLYVPPNVRVDMPVEAFFYISTALEGQFEHTLIVADRNSSVHFIEGCAAPIFRDFTFHDGAVEIYAHEGAKVRFTTIQNWSKSVVNFNNKRVIAERGVTVDWVEGSIGSRYSVVYPSVVLKGEGASTSMQVFSISKGPYIKDGGAKIFHLAPRTRSTIVSKSISAEGGVNIYRGLVRISKGARDAVSSVSCDSLLLDDQSNAVTIPHAQIDEPAAVFSHEAATFRLSPEVLFYLQSRGLDEDAARGLAVLGFISDIIRELPLEYASVLREVVSADFSGGVG